jgi:DNA (cytosine-5)-methyltransferase 1
MKYESQKYSEPENPVGTVAELFAGVGGFRIGLARAGWKTIFSNQWEPSTKAQHASDAYVANFGPEGHSNVDVSTLESIPEVDLLVGGFPCQDYSVAKTLNSSKGLEGKKGVLWWEILRFVQQQKPKFVFLENVDRLLKSPSSQRGRDFAIMLKTLADEGYLIEWRVVNAAEYGFAQRRIRVFIVARRLDLVDLSNFYPSDYLTKSGVLATALPVQKSNQAPTQIEIKETADVLSTDFNTGGGKSPFLVSGVFKDGIAHTLKTDAVLASKRTTLGDVLLSPDQVPDEYWIPEDRIPEWEFLKGAKTLERTHKSGAKYTYAEGKMAFPDLLTNPSRTILTGEGGTSPSRFKHIIKIGDRYRRLTPIELERLNGFPDDWTKFDDEGNQISDVRRSFFMGNALVIGLIQRVGSALADNSNTI